MTRSLTETLCENYLQESWPDVIIPVPMHNRRLRERGYDQALLLSRELAQQLKSFVNLPVNRFLIFRNKATKSQQKLRAVERRKNIKNAFSLRTIPVHRHVALVDDVVTTGETVNEIARLLKKHGVQQIDVWCLARTPNSY